jgi:ribosomal protein S18 acetylase RimI-like enzyme
VTVSPDTRRWQGFITPLAPELAAEWEGRTFAIIDMAVRREWRGRGIGRKLLETLLDSRHEDRATLTVEPAAEATQGFYRHLNWQKVGRKRTSEGFFIPYFDVYILPLAGQSRP